MTIENSEEYDVKSKRDVSTVISKREGNNSVLKDKKSNNPLKTQLATDLFMREILI
jgi:hypothetical protein